MIRAVRSGGPDLTVIGEVTWAVYTESGGGIKTCFERISNVFQKNNLHALTLVIERKVGFSCFLLFEAGEGGNLVFFRGLLCAKGVKNRGISL